MSPFDAAVVVAWWTEPRTEPTTTASLSDAHVSADLTALVARRRTCGGTPSWVLLELRRLRTGDLGTGTHGSIAVVGALRETSVVFATLIAVCLFGEGWGARRIVATVAVVAGLAILHVG